MFFPYPELQEFLNSHGYSELKSARMSFGSMHKMYVMGRPAHTVSKKSRILVSASCYGTFARQAEELLGTLEKAFSTEYLFCSGPVYIPVADIVCVRSKDRRLEVYTKDKKYLSPLSLSSIKHPLLVRIGRSAMVNKNAEMQRKGSVLHVEGLPFGLTITRHTKEVGAVVHATLNPDYHEQPLAKPFGILPELSRTLQEEINPTITVYKKGNSFYVTGIPDGDVKRRVLAQTWQVSTIRDTLLPIFDKNNVYCCGVCVPWDKIVAVKSSYNYTDVYTKDAEYLSNIPLRYFERLLQVNRNARVAPEAIATFKKGLAGIERNVPLFLKVSHPYTKNVRQEVNQDNGSRVRTGSVGSGESACGTEGIPVQSGS